MCIVYIVDADFREMELIYVLEFRRIFYYRFFPLDKSRQEQYSQWIYK